MEQTTATRIVIDVRSGIPFDRRIYRDIALAAVAAEVDKHGGQARAFFDDPKPSAFAEICASEMRAAEDAAKRNDAIAATGVYSPTEAEIAEQRKKLDEYAAMPMWQRRVSLTYTVECPVWNSDERHFEESDAQFRERIAFDTARLAEPRLRYRRARGARSIFRGVAGISKPGLDPTTDAIAAQNAARRVSEHALGIANAEIAKLRLERDAHVEAEQRAFEIWREAHPDSTIVTRPQMFVWLLEQLDAVTAEAYKLRATSAERVQAAARAFEPGLRDKLKARDADNANLRRRIDEALKQRDIAESKANGQACKAVLMSNALAEFAVQAVSDRHEIETLREQVNEERKAAASASERAHDARDVSLATLLDEAIERGDQLHAELRASDAALKETREGLGFANEAVARMMPLCKAAQDWELGKGHSRSAFGQFDLDLMEAVDAYQRACAQAADKNEQIPASEPASK